jgi:hypothetical protein
MEIDKALEAVQEIDRITRENPAIFLLIREMKERGNNIIPLETDRFVSQKVAAKILGTSIGTLCRLVKAKKIGVWILSGQTERKYRLSDLYRFMDECEVKQNDNTGAEKKGRGKTDADKEGVAV